MSDLQDQYDVLAASIVGILAEQKRTNELLAGIREALHLDDREAAKSFMISRLNAEGHRERSFDTAAFFDDYHTRHGSTAATPDKD